MDESNNVLVEDTENERTVAVYEWVEAAIFALVCVVLVFTFLFRIVGVDGESMQTTLMDHDRLILTRLNYTPERGDIVVINRYTQETTPWTSMPKPGRSFSTARCWMNLILTISRERIPWSFRGRLPFPRATFLSWETTG